MKLEDLEGAEPGKDQKRLEELNGKSFKIKRVYRIFLTDLTIIIDIVKAAPVLFFSTLPWENIYFPKLRFGEVGKKYFPKMRFGNTV